MSEDMLNIMGSFSETALDCIEKQNEEIEQLQQENQKKIYTSNGNEFTKYELLDDYERLLQENQQLKEKQPYNYITDDEYIKNIECKYHRSEEKNKLYKSVLDEIRECINNYDVFKEFSFPLMKRDEENQVKSSIDYEFQTSIKKNLLQILDKVKK